MYPDHESAKRYPAVLLPTMKAFSMHLKYSTAASAADARIRNFTPNFIKKDSSLNCPHE